MKDRKYHSSKLHESKMEYTSRLARTLKTSILEEIYAMYHNSNKTSIELNDTENVLIHFQKQLEKVVDLNDEKKNELARKILANSKCDYIEELLQATFILHTKILQIDEKLESEGKLELKVPALNEFIFESLINACRKVWKFAFLFIDSQNNVDYQKNSIELEEKIEESIRETVEMMLPVKQILEENIKKYKESHLDSDSDSDSDSDDEEEKNHKLFPKNIDKYKQQPQQPPQPPPPTPTPPPPVAQQIGGAPSTPLKIVDMPENQLNSLDSSVETFNFDDNDNGENGETPVHEPVQHNVSFASPPNVELKNISA